jgi:phosphoribosylformylglycinamidine synthase
VAILREQGVNSHIETAWAMHQAGFKAVDVHMSDLIAGRAKLDDFKGLIAVGGFSYGDVLGAGEGWAKTILFNAAAGRAVRRLLRRADTFGLGVCNGCQMMSNLKSIIPGAEAWPKFTRNKSEQFEARFGMVEVLDSPSIFFERHGRHAGADGDRARRRLCRLLADRRYLKVSVALRYVDNRGQATEQYPFNPNGSPGGLTAVTTPDGRFTVMMPHAERVFRTVHHVLASGWLGRGFALDAHVPQGLLDLGLLHQLFAEGRQLALLQLFGDLLLDFFQRRDLGTARVSSSLITW